MRAGIIRDLLTLRLHGILALGAITLAGCGAGTTYSRAEGNVVRVKLDEFRIVPADVEVSAGRVELRATDVGHLTHNLQVETWDPKPGDEPHVYGRTNTLHPGESGAERAPITLKPGLYRLTCTIANHDDLGQYGKLKVTG
jgi:uncharacterized cupredoxin-like copper-binding protein